LTVETREADEAAVWDPAVWMVGNVGDQSEVCRLVPKPLTGLTILQSIRTGLYREFEMYLGFRVAISRTAKIALMRLASLSGVSGQGSPHLTGTWTNLLLAVT
jgi:hypothetical protein